MRSSAYYELYGALLFVVLAVLPMVFAIVPSLRWPRARRQGDGHKALQKVLLGSGVALTVYAMVVVDAYLIEPNWPDLQQVTIEGRVKSELRVLHISDLHIETDAAPWEKWLADTVSRLSPDMIFITGDILQIGNEDGACLKRVTKNFKPPLGVYACAGYDNLAVLKPVDTNIVYLQDSDAIVRHDSDLIAVAGSPRTRLLVRSNLFGNADVGIVIEHTPDYTEAAISASADLYLCGHTHGGQVRIPFWGAIITLSRTGKKYESGLYRAGGMFIHTSRGLGLEPRPAPQVRFFCRPEATLIKIVPRAVSL